MAEYQRLLYQHRRTDLLAERRGQLVDDHPLPVATTWSLSFAQVEQNNPAAADLLRLCAFLAPDAIPEGIITQGAEHLGPQLAAVGADPYLLNQSIEALRAYSLLHRETNSETAPLLSVHRLVQAVQRESMTAEGEKQWKQRAVLAVNASYPDVQEVSQWDACERWLPHALLCAELIAQEQMTVPEGARLLNKVGWYLADRARYVEAEPLYERALSIHEQQLGPEHPLTAVSLIHLASLYERQGKYKQTEPLVVRALAIDEKVYGAEHLEVATDLAHLGYLYRVQGKYEQAEPLLKRALQICEQQLGAQHPVTASIRANYTFLLQTMGHENETKEQGTS